MELHNLAESVQHLLGFLTELHHRLVFFVAKFDLFLLHHPKECCRQALFVARFIHGLLLSQKQFFMFWHVLWQNLIIVWNYPERSSFNAGSGSDVSLELEQLPRNF